MERRTDFFKFLLKHDALIPFINNLDLEKKPDLFQHNPNCWIYIAFSWGETPEGYNYWSILDNYWLQKCSTL